MTDKASPGWVVQIMVPGPAGGPATFRYFNVAIADANKAIHAAVEHAEPPTEARVSPVRKLSSAEVAALHLKAGAVKPA
jgi:hypothetical protein